MYPHTGLDSTNKSFNDASFGLFVVCSETADAFFLQKSNSSLFRVFFPLSVCIFCGPSLFLRRRRNVAVSEDVNLFFKVIDQAFFENTLMTVRRKVWPTTIASPTPPGRGAKHDTNDRPPQNVRFVSGCNKCYL